MTIEILFAITGTIIVGVIITTIFLAIRGSED